MVEREGGVWFVDINLFVSRNPSQAQIRFLRNRLVALAKEAIKERSRGKFADIVQAAIEITECCRSPWHQRYGKRGKGLECPDCGFDVLGSLKLFA